MKLLTLIILAFLSTSYADSLEDISAGIQDLERQRASIEADLKALRTIRREERKNDGKWGPFVTEKSANPDALAEIQGINADIDKLKANRSKIDADLRALRKQEREEERRIAKERAEQERKLKEEERQRSKAERDARKEQERAEARARNEEKQKERELGFLRQKLKRIDVESDLSKIDYGTLTLQEELSELQSAYDKSLLGAYLQEKMKLLLSSNVMCESINNCSGGKRSGAVSELESKLTKDVFPDQKSGSGTRSGSGGKR